MWDVFVTYLYLLLYIGLSSGQIFFNRMVTDHMEVLHESERVSNDVQYLGEINLRREELCMLRMDPKVENFDGRYCIELQLKPNKNEMGLSEDFLEYFKWLKFDVVNAIIPGDSVGPLGAQLIFGPSAHVLKGREYERFMRKLANSTAVEMLLKQIFGSIILDCTYHSRSTCEPSKYRTVVMDTVFTELKGNSALNRLLSRPVFDSFIGFPTVGLVAQFDTVVGFWHEHLFSGLDKSQFCRSSSSDQSGAEDGVNFCERKTSFMNLMPLKKLAFWHQHPPTQWQVKQCSLLLNHQEKKGLFISYCEIGSQKSRQKNLSASAECGCTTGSAQSIPPCELPQDYNKEHNVELKLINLQRTLIGKGSHRQLSSSMKFTYQSNHSSTLVAPFCEIVMMERLQSGIFVDPFELQRLVHRGTLNAAYVYGDANLELPAFHSHQSIIEVHAATNVDLDFLLGTNIELDLKVDLPLHARYPPLNRESYSTVSISMPHLMLHCGCESQMVNIQDSRCMQREGNETWAWITWNNNALQSSEVLKWKIPSGNQLHAEFVSIFTAFSALVSVIAIFLAALHSSASYRYMKSARTIVLA